MRILLAGMSNMLTSVINAALGESQDIIIAGATSEHDDLAARIRAAQADAVVMQVAKPSDPERFRPLLLSFPALKVIAITGDGKRGFLHEMHLRSIQLLGLSSATLLTALRGGRIKRTH
jgi:hypothetical protein